MKVMKNQPFKLIYIDAFAGTGEINTNEDEDSRKSIEWSVKRAIKKPFDQFILIEKNKNCIKQLNAIKEENIDRNIEIIQEDANIALKEICARRNWRKERAVIF